MDCPLSLRIRLMIRGPSWTQLSLRGEDHHGISLTSAGLVADPHEIVQEGVDEPIWVSVVGEVDDYLFC